MKTDAEIVALFRAVGEARDAETRALIAGAATLTSQTATQEERDAAQAAVTDARQARAVARVALVEAAEGDA